MRQEKYSAIARRVVDENGAVVGMLLQLANLRWAIFDQNEKRLGRNSWRTADEAFAGFKMYHTSLTRKSA
jgi:hypothetical protein